MGVLATAVGCLPTTASPGVWHLSWRSENVVPAAAVPLPRTCRYTAKLTGYGSRVRAEFLNPLGVGGYHIAQAALSQAAGNGTLAVLRGTSRRLTFQGSGQVDVRGGSAVLTDPLTLAVHPGTVVAVTLTVTSGTASHSRHPVEQAACAPGTQPDPGEAPASRFSQPDTIRWLSSIMVDGPAQRSVVALGDSITEGSIGDGYRRWTDRIATSGVVIANAGVGGNAISAPGYLKTLGGVSRLQMLRREPNLTDVVIMLGVNDLTMGRTATQIITALGKAVALARSAHVAVWVATITPYRGQYQWTQLQESYRTQINNFLRAARPSPGVAVTDLDRALRDPRQPDRLLPAYDSGDHQHPSKIAGRTAIAQRVRADLHLP